MIELTTSGLRSRRIAERDRRTGAQWCCGEHAGARHGARVSNRSSYLLALSVATATAATVPAPAASSHNAAGAAPQSMLT